MTFLSDKINLFAIIAPLVLFSITIGIVALYFKEIKNKKPSGIKKEGDWDGITEYDNPIPLGWGVTFFVLILWGCWYFLLGYPLWSYSQVGEYNKEAREFNQEIEEKWAHPSKKVLLSMGESVYLVQCAPCHGITGDGLNGVAQDFLTWGTPQNVKEIIEKGSSGIGSYMVAMPNRQAILNSKTSKPIDDDEIDKISHFVSGGFKDSSVKPLFDAYCSVCHGQNGDGIAGLAPKINDYGQPSYILMILKNGKKGEIGQMPVFTDNRLSSLQKEAVANYVSLLKRR